MKSALLTIVACSLALAPAAETFGQVYGRSQLLSAPDLRQMGLTREWFVQIRVDSRRGGLGHLTQHVSSIEAETIYEVKYEEGIERFTERELDAFGEPIGKVEAKRRADARANVLTADGFTPQVAERVIPEIAIYATTTRAVLHAIDGRTGATRWTVSLGDPNYSTEAPGANDSYVAAINGSHVTLFDKNDGKQLWRRPTVGVPGAGPAVNDTYVFAPMVSGSVEAYPIDKEKNPPNVYRSTGRAMYQPVATNDTVSWSTDRGHLYVGRATSKGVRFRLETQRMVSATPTILPDQKIIAASLDGYVYCLHENSGDILWRYSTGVAVEQPPVVIGEAVYVITSDGGMYKLNLENGERIWWTPDVAKFLSASKTRIYCTTPGRELVALDVETGGRVGAMMLGKYDLSMMNTVTDRIYLATADGLIQCLREDLPEYEVPYYHSGVGGEGQQRREVIREEAPAAEPMAEPEPAAPAGGEGNPFAPQPPANPFNPPAADGNEPMPPPAGNANPFGGNDPFGGDDPFGGN